MISTIQTMKISTKCIDALPPLSWVAEVDTTGGIVAVSHGKWVEIQDNFFVEGIWDGPFGAGQFHKTPNFFGSGAVLVPDGVVFVPSGATTDYLYYRMAGVLVTVSNSLPGLLSHLGDSLDPANNDYWRDCESITDGIDQYQPTITTRSGSVQRLLYRNLMIGTGGITLLDKPEPPPFVTYEDYVGFLRSRYGQIAMNARDPGRDRQLKILSTQSKGYDSTAVNAIAAEFGIDTAFTVSKSKGSGAFAENDTELQDDDDGREIARQLGFDCVAIDRRRFQDGLAEEYLYFAGIANCEDLNFSGITPHIDSPSVLITGTLGELYYPGWYYAQRFPGSTAGADLRRGDLGGHGLTEVRLQTGFVHLPLIFMGAQHRAAVTRITESREMDPWRLNTTTYDRPIARRIAEEAGVPRLAFGQKKMATTVSFSRPNIPYQAGLRREFFSFLDKAGILPRWQAALFPLVHRINSLIWFKTARRYRWLYYISRLHAKLTGKPLPLLWTRIESSLYCFSVNKRIADYSRALDSRQA
jgi:hypothetical protein